MQPSTPASNEAGLTLVLAATGKTGRRVVDRLQAQGRPVRLGSRTAAIPFDWEDATTWAPALEGVEAAYVVFVPDLAVPAAPPALRAFTQLALEAGVQRLVLLSGRGEEEALRCEQIVQEAGIDWTVVRASWFAQNFSEGDFRDLVLAGELTLPAGDMQEPFIDADDIADVVVAALTESGHVGRVYEVTGPRLMSFADVAAELAEASGRPVRYVPIPLEAFVEALTAQGVPGPYVDLLRYLFTITLDGRNAFVADGVEQALGRTPRDFRAYARTAAASGAWQHQTTGV